MSFTLRFHSLHEIKRNKVLFLLGLSNKQYVSANWDTYFKIEKFIPNIQKSEKRKIQREALPSRREIEQTSLTPRKVLQQLLQLIRIPSFMKKNDQNGNNQSNKFSLFSKSKHKETTYKIKIENINVRSKSTKPLVPYGKEVSEDEMKKLVKNIPTPPR